ncbi:MAG: AAA family ATPase [Clostridiales bacterium]|nr:AAA family ATPase [Clostridiales bacterium]
MIGRDTETNYLKSLKNEEEHQFVAVYGRRRVGKTYLIRESFGYEFTFQHTGLSVNDEKTSETQRQEQLDKFAQSLSEAGYKSGKKLSSWGDAFNGLKELIKKSKAKKKVIFIDELSWMDTKDSGLISELEHFWNGWVTARKEKDVILIVCASATYWMMDKIVNDKGGLHNRLTGQIHLKPFTLKECEEYLITRKIILSRHQIIQCYMILGGVPYYWSLLKKGKSLPQNIDELFFADKAPLQYEYNNLYRALFKKPNQYIKIIEALSTENKGICRADICKKTGIASSGELTKKLKELEDCGFIRKYIPFGNIERNAIYQLIDNYTLFYLRFMNKQTYDEKFWEVQNNSSAINAWSGVAFERVCLEHVPQIKKALGIAGVHTNVNVWQCQSDMKKGLQGSQIDLLIVRDDQIINVCEIKYSKTNYRIDAAFDKAMRRKISDYLIDSKTKYAIHPTLITTYGVVENSYSGELQTVITGEDLFNY